MRDNLVLATSLVCDEFLFFGLTSVFVFSTPLWFDSRIIEHYDTFGPKVANNLSFFLWGLDFSTDLIRQCHNERNVTGRALSVSLPQSDLEFAGTGYVQDNQVDSMTSSEASPSDGILFHDIVLLRLTLADSVASLSIDQEFVKYEVLTCLCIFT